MTIKELDQKREEDFKEYKEKILLKTKEEIFELAYVISVYEGARNFLENNPECEKTLEECVTLYEESCFEEQGIEEFLSEKL